MDGAVRATVEAWGPGLGFVGLENSELGCRSGLNRQQGLIPSPLFRIASSAILYQHGVAKPTTAPTAATLRHRASQMKQTQDAIPRRGPSPHLDKHGVTESVGGVPRYLAVVKVRHAAQVAAARTLYGGIRQTGTCSCQTANGLESSRLRFREPHGLATHCCTVYLSATVSPELRASLVQPPAPR